MRWVGDAGGVRGCLTGVSTIVNLYQFPNYGLNVLPVDRLSEGDLRETVFAGEAVMPFVYALAYIQIWEFNQSFIGSVLPRTRRLLAGHVLMAGGAHSGGPARSRSHPAIPPCNTGSDGFPMVAATSASRGIEGKPPCDRDRSPPARNDRRKGSARRKSGLAVGQQQSLTLSPPGNMWRIRSPSGSAGGMKSRQGTERSRPRPGHRLFRGFRPAA